MKAALWLLLLFSFPVRAQEVYFTPSRDCENAVIRGIDGAATIDAAVYAVNNPNIVQALKRAHDRGAKIRLISDRLQAAGKSSKIQELKDYGIPVRLNSKMKIEHNKFAVFDGRTVITGSFNWTAPASEKNSENCIVFPNPAAPYAERFKWLWDYYDREKKQSPGEQ